MGRHKIVEDDELLAIARSVFTQKGVSATTREIARRAGISEAVIYQRHPTKAHLFLSAMVPPPLDVESLLAEPTKDIALDVRLEEIALGMMKYFREVMPILIQLVTHPEFDIKTFSKRHPDSGLGRIQQGLIQYLETQRANSRIAVENVMPVAMTLFASLHSFAFLELLGAHGGRFDDSIIRSMVKTLWNGLAPRLK
jgi:AcrR family transcriptional regulator